MHIKGVNLGNEAARNRTVKEGEKDVVCYGYARERVCTERNDLMMQLTPPGNALFELRTRLLGRVCARLTGVTGLALTPLTLVRDPLVTDVIKGARPIRLKILMILPQIESSAGAG